MYKPPDNSRYIDFNNKLYDILSTANSENKECILTGDLNCNYLLARDHADIKDIFTANGFKQVITDATRTTNISKTLIDVIMMQQECPSR